MSETITRKNASQLWVHVLNDRTFGGSVYQRFLLLLIHLCLYPYRLLCLFLITGFLYRFYRPYPTFLVDPEHKRHDYTIPKTWGPKHERVLRRAEGEPLFPKSNLPSHCITLAHLLTTLNHNLICTCSFILGQGTHWAGLGLCGLGLGLMSSSKMLHGTHSTWNPHWWSIPVHPLYHSPETTKSKCLTSIFRISFPDKHTLSI